MKRVDVHIHLHGGDLDDPITEVHLHLHAAEATEVAADGISFSRELIARAGGSGSLQARSAGSGRLGAGSGRLGAGSGRFAAGSGRLTAGGSGKLAGLEPTTSLRLEQIVAPNVYSLTVVPPFPDALFSEVFRPLIDGEVFLESLRSTGSGLRVWESFMPTESSGMWQFHVVPSFERMFGALSTKDMPYTWLTRDWTLKGPVDLIPVAPADLIGRLPRLQLTPK